MDNDTPAIKKGGFDPQRPLAHMGRHLIVALVVLGAVIAYYVSRYSIGEGVVSTFLAIPPLLIAAMLVVQLVYIAIQGSFFQQAYGALGFRRPFVYGASIFLGMNLVNTLAPVAGLSGSFYMVHLEHRSGMRRSESILINFIYYLIDYVVFLVLLLVALWLLLIWGEVTRPILITSLIFTLFVSGFVIAGLVLLSHPTALRKLLATLGRWGGTILRRKRSLLSDERIDTFVVQAKEGWKKSYQNWPSLVRASLAAFGLHFASVILLWLAFQAVHIDASVQILAAGYTIGTLLNIVSVTPGGIGFAEGGMTAIFVALGIPVEQALVVSLIYRTVFIWFSLLLGLPAIQALPRMAGNPSRS